MKPNRLVSYFLDDALKPDERMDEAASEIHDESTAQVMAVHMMCTDYFSPVKPNAEEIRRTTSHLCRISQSNLIPQGGMPMVTTQEQSVFETEETALEESSFSTVAGNRLGALPWWLISATAHAIFLFFTLIIQVGGQSVLPDIELVKVDIAAPPPEKKKEDIKFDLNKKVQVNLEKKSDQVFYTPEKLEVTEQRVETENEVQSEMPARGQEDAISTIPAEGKGSIGFFGVGGGGKAGAFGWRTGGGRKQRALKNGGSTESESSVDYGLEWLARNQEPQGHWDAVKHGSNYKRDDALMATEGVSGLALLAFLGAGHTEKHGKYKDNVKRAQDWLIMQQKPNGYLGTEGKYPAGYGHAILGLASAEGYGMAQNKALGQVAQNAINYTCNEHQCVENGEYSAWRYKAKEGPDTSVTGWFVMQVKSAKVAGLTVPGHAAMGAMNWLNKVQPIPDKSTGYDEAGKARYRPERSPEPRITSVATLARLFLGTKPNEPVIQGAALYMTNNPPGISRATGVDFYYIYYGTLAMFQVGGDRWQRWNDYIREPLIGLQSKAPGPDQGSWDPIDGTSAGSINSAAGRVYTTAVAILSLEVYYRYLPMYRD